LQCVAVRCSVLQCVAVCCSALQCVAVYCRVLQCDASYARNWVGPRLLLSVTFVCLSHLCVRHTPKSHAPRTYSTHVTPAKRVSCRGQRGIGCLIFVGLFLILSAKEPYNYWLFCQKRPASYGTASYASSPPCTYVTYAKRRPIGCLQLQVIFRKRASNYRALFAKNGLQR